MDEAFGIGMLDGGKDGREVSNPPQRLFGVLVAKQVGVGVERGTGESSTRHRYWVLNGDIICTCCETMKKEFSRLEHLIVSGVVNDAIVH